MEQAKLIKTAGQLRELVALVRGERHLALDTEANSFYAYRSRICLIQLSGQQGDFIIDPLVLKDLSALATLLADPRIEKIFHAAENDIVGLKRDFRFCLCHIFDTAVASQLLGRRRLGLAGILSEEFGVSIAKKFQRCNWEKRPLSPEQLRYAQMDTHFLIELRHRLHRQLLERNLWQQAQSRFAALERLRPTPARSFDPRAYIQLEGARDLPGPSLTALKALFLYRERRARRANLAPFRIMSNDLMVRLAREMPASRAALAKMPGLPRHFKGRGADSLLRLINKSRP